MAQVSLSWRLLLSFFKKEWRLWREIPGSIRSAQFLKEPE